MTAESPSFELKDVRIEPLADPYALDDFNSGESSVDSAIRNCPDFHSRYRRRVYCAHIGPESSVAGFYCLGPSTVDSAAVPNSLINKDNHFAGVMPLVFLHLIAVQKHLQGKKIGTLLLGHFLDMCVNNMKNVGIYGVGLKALNSRTADLYSKFGFYVVDEKAKSPLMILPVQALVDLDKYAQGLTA